MRRKYGPDFQQLPHLNIAIGSRPAEEQLAAMEDGLRFAIREGGRTVGAGVVEQIIE